MTNIKQSLSHLMTQKSLEQQTVWDTKTEAEFSQGFPWLEPHSAGPAVSPLWRWLLWVLPILALTQM